MPTFETQLLKVIQITQRLFGDKPVVFDSWCDPSFPEEIMLKCLVSGISPEQDLERRIQWHTEVGSITPIALDIIYEN